MSVGRERHTATLRPCSTRLRASDRRNRRRCRTMIAAAAVPTLVARLCLGKELQIVLDAVGDSVEQVRARLPAQRRPAARKGGQRQKNQRGRVRSEVGF